MSFRSTLAGLISGGKRIAVVDTTKPPTADNVPQAWSRAYMGPGQPVSGMLSARDQDRELEPRTFQYPANVNATMSPRAAYGLMPFADLRAYAENIPEVSMCIRIITEELKAFNPRIVDGQGNEINDPSLKWMITYPDHFNPFPVWLSRFLYNVLVYDAPALYTPRDSNHQIMAMRIVDGSTIFAMVDEHGEQPRPPAPAFSQVIYGIPRGMLNTYQLYYRPRHLRADAPYGRSPIEDCLPAVQLLAKIWEYQQGWYTEGNVPEQMLSAPPSWTVQQVLDYEDTFNARQAGNTNERAGRVRFMPNGVESIVTKDATFRKEEYDVAANTVRMTFGIPRTEFGETPGSGGLGGSGFLEAMQSVFYRLGIAPVKSYIESAFDYVLGENGYPDAHMELAFPKESLDPKKEEDKAIARFTQGITTRDEARQSIGLKALGGEEGSFIINPGGGQAGDGMQGNMIPVTNRIPVVDFSEKIPVSGGEKIPVLEAGEEADMIPVKEQESIPVRKGCGLDSEDDAYFGAPVNVLDGKATVITGRLAEQVVNWQPGVEPFDEGVYLLDRAIAPDDQRYLVPVTYQSDVDGQIGLVTFPVDGARTAKSVRTYSGEWLEQAAVLDYVAGVTRNEEQYLTHPDDSKRMVLLPTGIAFGDPDSIIVRAAAGTQLSAEMRQSLITIDGDAVLWHDIGEIAGEEAVQGARGRIEILLQSGHIPAGV